MREIFSLIGIVLIGVAAIAGASYGLYQGTAFYAPRYEAIRRETVEQSKSFRDGAVRNLRDYQARYLAAKTDGERDALRAAIEQELTSYDEDNLPYDLRTFVRSIRS